MDLKQCKLTKEEWNALEVPLPDKELSILKMIDNSFDNVNFVSNESISLNTYMKVLNDFELYNYHFYKLYFMKIISEIKRKYDLSINVNINVGKIKKLKKADEFRIKNLQKKIKEVKYKIYEYILLDLCVMFLKTNDNEKPKWYYTIKRLLKNNVVNINTHIIDFINNVLEIKKQKIKKLKYLLIKNAETYIEKNIYLSKYSNLELYEHQKKIFTIAKNDNPKCILYQAPTGTGKTLSPIGLKNKYKIIFVCAAKHIGLQLAKACISMEIPIAIAFGCNDTDDIRLHYYAAKEIVRNRRTGGIFRVDNSVGDKVEIIISDIQSYLYAMRYMQAFNKDRDILWYWDEPTITLDYENHEFHEILKNNWQKNEIPNVVLSSATLPDKDKILPMVYGFKNRFKNCEISEIKSFDCKKTISLIDSNGYVIMPHILANNNKKKLKKYSKYINNNKTLLRHVDVNELSKFICFVNKNKLIKDVYTIENYFETIESIDIISIKLYYLKILKIVKEISESLWKTYKSKFKKEYRSNIKITTSDSYTLTDGPTIFLAENIEKLALFYLKASNIPTQELNNLIKIIEENDVYRKELDKVVFEEKERQDKISDKKTDKDNKMDSKEYQKLEEFDRKVSMLKSKIKPIQLKSRYIPNTKQHIAANLNINVMNSIDKHRVDRCFKSEIDDEIVEQIMLLDVRDEWKILLLMGIGVFVEHKCKEYRDIMKKLAQQQKLYLILASSDYIYGTNYQFCHGYLGKDLENMTQEKMLQAFGRVGRKNNQLEYTLRIRDDTLIEKLYSEDPNTLEIDNMNELFG
tara:strand:+ start:1841 stop:4252 length:2412 start_codon:yes stop_codon:yes gene_type:complete